MAYTVCPPRTAAGTHVHKAHAAPTYLMAPGRVSKIPSLVKWNVHKRTKPYRDAKGNRCLPVIVK